MPQRNIMSSITIPAGIHIFDREIDIEIEYNRDSAAYEIYQVSNHGPNIPIGLLRMTPKLIGALEAAAEYQANI